jgi:hypothetical protein
MQRSKEIEYRKSGSENLKVEEKKKKIERVKDENFGKKIEYQEQEMMLDEKLENELFKDIFDTQKDCLDIIQRLNKKAEETTNIAIESVELLRQQREELEEVDKTLDELGNNTKRAGREVAIILRRLATDKVIIVTVLLAFIAITILLFVGIGFFVYNVGKNRGWWK